VYHGASAVNYICGCPVLSVDENDGLVMYCCVFGLARFSVAAVVDYYLLLVDVDCPEP